MIYMVFLIRDTALDTYMIPNFFVSEGQARRSFSDAVNNKAPDNLLNTHPEHFSLYYAGVFNDQTGAFVSEAPSFIMSGNEAVFERTNDAF
nr:MAG: nonstructural protein [Microvirus sp.]